MRLGNASYRNTGVHGADLVRSSRTAAKTLLLQGVMYHTY